MLVIMLCQSMTDTIMPPRCCMHDRLYLLPFNESLLSNESFPSNESRFKSPTPVRCEFKLCSVTVVESNRWWCITREHFKSTMLVMGLGVAQ
jgi:hypothetical protein